MKPGSTAMLLSPSTGKRTPVKIEQIDDKTKIAVVSDPSNPKAKQTVLIDRLQEVEGPVKIKTSQRGSPQNTLPHRRQLFIRATSNPLRKKILNALADNPGLSLVELSDVLRHDKDAIQQHLKILIRANLVTDNAGTEFVQYAATRNYHWISKRVEI